MQPCPNVPVRDHVPDRHNATATSTQPAWEQDRPPYFMTID
ncbi:hypothetical protein [Komagataeibacter europaeus]|nr:hypothetical protein [Komagataeibacter europaeus]